MDGIQFPLAVPFNVGGNMMACSEDVAGTLRAQEHGYQPLVLATQQGGAELGVPYRADMVGATAWGPV